MNSMQTSSGASDSHRGKNFPDDAKELVATNPSHRNWPGILISLLVIGVISSLIITCVILLTPADLGPRITGHLVTLDDVIKDTYRVPPFAGQWISDELVFRDDFGGVSVYDARIRRTRTLVTNGTLRQTNTEEFWVSPDLNFVLLSSKRNSNREHHHGTRYWILAVDTGYITALRPESGTGHAALQYAAWVPAGDSGSGQPSSALLIAHDNNLYYRQRADGADWQPVTTDGRPGELFHGVADPLYRDHILDSEVAAWPSPGGSGILYFSIDSRGVQLRPYTVYSATGPATVHSVRCPAAGGVNPVLTVTVVNVSEPRQMQYHTILPPAQLQDQEVYAAGVGWQDESRVSVTWYNRRQNASYVCLCAAPDWRCHTIYRAEVDFGWLEIGAGPVFCADGHSALLLDRPAGKDGSLHQQIMQVNITTGSVQQITSDAADVHTILACGADYIYYLSSLADQPGQRHVYRVATVHPATPHCMTCSQLMGPQRPHSQLCLHHDAVFSADARHYALLCLGPAVPHVTISAAGASQMALLRNNTALRAAAAAASLPAVRALRVPLSSGGEAAVRLLVPPQHRAGDLEVYPLLLRLDTDRRRQAGAAELGWTVDWATYLASRRQMAVADVTLPGPPATEWSAVAETAALRQVVASLTSQLEFASPLRVVVVGRGYGGQMALRLLAETEPVTRCAVAIAPITSWHNYASAFSERRLGLPADSPRRYSDADIDQWAAGLADKRFLLVHGSADTTVSVQQTFLLARWLETAGTLFTQTIYPDESHGLDGVLEHLYQSLDQYMYDCLLPEDVQKLVVTDQW